MNICFIGIVEVDTVTFSCLQPNLKVMTLGLNLLKPYLNLIKAQLKHENETKLSSNLTLP